MFSFLVSSLGREFVEVSIKDVWSMYKVCVDELVEQRESYWCQLLSLTNLQTLHQINNIKAFWKKGESELHWVACSWLELTFD